MVVEDFPSFRQYLLLKLGERADLKVICEVADGLEAVKKAQELQPDLILLDIGLPTLDGMGAARRIRGLAPESKIIFLSQETGAEFIQEAASLGAGGYVFKTLAESQLLPAIDAVLSGQRFVSNL